MARGMSVTRANGSSAASASGKIGKTRAAVNMNACDWKGRRRAQTQVSVPKHTDLYPDTTGAVSKH
eukprot:41544-Eustigmatos_ZCMA.PRE.1